MQKIISACDDKGTLVASTELGLQLCVDKNVAHKKKKHCMHMGCSLFNRDEYGISGGDVHDLGDDVYSVGFSLAKCADARSIQAAPGSAEEQHNIEMVAQSGGLLASPEPSTLMSMSLCTGPLNQLMRCIFYEVPTTKDAYGKMNLDKIMSKDPFCSAMPWRKASSGLSYIGRSARSGRGSSRWLLPRGTQGRNYKGLSINSRYCGASTRSFSR